MEHAHEIVIFAKDVAFLALVLLALVAVFGLYRKISGLLNSVKHTAENTDQVVSLLSTRLLGPLVASSSVALGIGKITAFLFGFGKDRANKGEQDTFHKKNTDRED